MIQQQRRAENDRRELTLDLAFVGLGSRDSSYWHNAPKFNHQAAMALFIGVNHGRGADLARIEMASQRKPLRVVWVVSSAVKGIQRASGDIRISPL
jgi:hypothetical protein